MFKATKKANGEETVLYEITDKDYGVNLKTLKLKELPTIVKFPILRSYQDYISSPKEKVTRYCTQISKLDELIGGGLSAGLYVIGANPGLGKTSLALHIILNLAVSQHHSLVFNLEMSNLQIITKLLSNYSYRNSLDDETVKSFTINDLTSKQLYNSTSEEFDSNLSSLYESYSDKIDSFINIVTYSDENDCRYVEFIENALQNYNKYHNIKPIVVIDFLQLLHVKPTYDATNKIDNKPLNRRLEVDTIIEKLKKYSKKYDVPIIIISSLSRSGYTKEDGNDYDHEYSLSVFKETGQIEYTADFIALLTRGETKVNFDGADAEIINLNVLKNRFGKTGGKLPLVFLSEYSYFDED